MLFCSSCLNKLKKKRSFVPSFSLWPSANALNTFIQCLPVLPNNWDSANCIRLEPRIPASITSCISLQSSATVEAVLHTKATPKPELRRSKNSQRFTHTVKRPTQQLEKRNDCALVKRRPKQSPANRTCPPDSPRQSEEGMYAPHRPKKAVHDSWSISYTLTLVRNSDGRNTAQCNLSVRAKSRH